MACGAADLELITSPANSLVKLCRQLATRRRARYREGRFLIEGERALRTAIEHQAQIDTIIVDYERVGDIPPALVRVFEAGARRIVAMDHALFLSITDAGTPQPVLAVARIPITDFPAKSTGVVALDAVRDPGNLGTIVRTASAAGVDGVILLPGCVDPFNPKSVRASAGTVTSVPMRQAASITAVLQEYFQEPETVSVLAAEANGTADYRDVDWKNPYLLVVGNESRGVGQATQTSMMRTVRIPMAEGIESLNVSVATGILLFQMRSHRSS